jgi:hypothetical protein
MADKVKVRVNTSELIGALKAYQKHSSRSMPQIINGTAIDVAFKANRAAKKASVSKIPKYKEGDQSAKSTRLYHALATIGKNKFGPKPKGSGNKNTAETLAKRRYSAISYSKAIFLKLAQDLGKKLRVGIGSRGLPDNAKARKAKESPVCFADLTIVGIEKSHADKIIQPALQKGIAAAAKAKRDRIAKKLAEGAKKHSGRGKR